MIWGVVIILFLACSILYFFSRKKEHKMNSIKNKLHDEILHSDIDYSNIFKSSFEATYLYNQLKVIYHPDRFILPEKKEIATKLFQEITQNKYNYKKLLEIKKIAEKEL